MAHVVESIVISAPIGDVFKVIADYRRALSWMEGFSRFEIEPGPASGVGARVRAAGAFLGFTVETQLEIVEYECPHRLVSRTGGPIRSITAWLLTEVNDGTLVRFVGDYELPLALRLAGDRGFEQLVSGQIRRSLQNLDHLFRPNAPGLKNC